MEALKEIIEIFKEFDVNNVWIVIGASVALIFIAAGYIQLLNASKIEAILMNQKEESKRFGFVYLILFAVLGLINYVFIVNNEFVLVSAALWFLTLVASFGLRILKNKGKFEKAYWWVEERKALLIIMTSTAMLVFVATKMVSINIISCVILGALVEVLIIAITYLNTGTMYTIFNLLLA